MNSATLLIGGNQGDRRLLIDQATELIRQRIGSVVALSSVYETEPWGDFVTPPQNFLNRAMEVETTLSPWQVLRTALDIERELGRKRDSKGPKVTNDLKNFNVPRLYHSRPMDIDLIFYDDLMIDTPELTLPHPRMHLRRFVLEPLAEIIPEYRHPIMGKTVTELLSEL